SALLLSCGDNKTQKENYIVYVNYDTLVINTSLKENVAVDSLFTIKNDGIIPPSIIIDSVKYYIVEGDIRLNEYEYTQYKISHLVVSFDSMLLEGKLLGERRNNKIVRWPENYVIKYCIARNSFQTFNQYNMI